MTYETPAFFELTEIYEAPVLVDLEDLPACREDCYTGGSAADQQIGTAN